MVAETPMATTTMPDYTPDAAYEQFLAKEALIRAAEGSNEANTRLRAINTMLFDVLGWDEREIDAEKYCRANGYADYAFFQDGDCSMVLEAKKSGATFVLPNVAFPVQPVGFQLIATECPDAVTALRQALGYAAGLGARYIAISNGHQWILMLTYVQNQPIEERSVFVFESLDALKAGRFRLFFETFSPIAINANSPADSLLESRKAPAPPKLSATIANYPVPADRNQIVNELSTVVDLVWDEVRLAEDEVAFLKACYVAPQGTASTLAQASELLQQRLTSDETLRVKAHDSEDLPALLKSFTGEKPIIVLGRVGHGKSTFLRYLRLIKAPEILSKYIQLDINFIDRPDSPDQVGPYLYKEIVAQLKANYDIDVTRNNMVRGVLHSDLESFTATPEGVQYPPDSQQFKDAELAFIKAIRDDSHKYLEKVFLHLKLGRGYSVAIFLDNLDRRNDPIQEEAFLRASAIARDWSALVFVCLRPETYYRSKRFGVMDSVAPRVVTVTSPQSRKLIVRRLEYAKEIANGDVTARPAFTRETSLILPTTAEFLAGCIKSFQRSDALCDVFDAVANGNARDVLAFVEQMLTSMHLNTDDILKRFRTGGFDMPVHEALRALLFVNSFQYDPTRSAFVNLFDLDRADPQEHFTRFITLRHLCSAPVDRVERGYLPLTTIIRYLCQLGYSEEHAKGTIQLLFRRRCCEADIPLEEWSNDIKKLKATHLGRYQVIELVKTFTYFDAVVVDTPILDSDVRAQIIDYIDIQQRINRASVFLEYLDKCASDMQDSAFKEWWTEVREGVKENIRRVRSSAGRRRRR
jgi:hypothetical protein